MVDLSSFLFLYKADNFKIPETNKGLHGKKKAADNKNRRNKAQYGQKAENTVECSL